jgi:hypothetical protein
MAQLVANCVIQSVGAGTYTVRVQLVAEDGSLVDEAVSLPVTIAAEVAGSAEVQVPQVGIRGKGPGPKPPRVAPS